MHVVSERESALRSGGAPTEGTGGAANSTFHISYFLRSHDTFDIKVVAPGSC